MQYNNAIVNLRTYLKYRNYRIGFALTTTFVVLQNYKISVHPFVIKTDTFEKVDREREKLTSDLK